MNRHIPIIIAALLPTIPLMGLAQEWVLIGAPGNATQSSANREHGESGGDGYGAVPYVYRIGYTVVRIADWAEFYNSLGSDRIGSFSESYNYWNSASAGTSVGLNAPAVNISFHEAAQYCNWLTTGSATNGAYTIDAFGEVIAVDRSFRNNNGKLYVLPNADEWFKAAYFNVATGQYTLYAHGADTAPAKSVDGSTGWNYNWALTHPNWVWPADAGSEEQNGTCNLMGNVHEWGETEFVPGQRQQHGGAAGSAVSSLASSYSATASPISRDAYLGFRVVELSDPPVPPVYIPPAITAIERLPTGIRLAWSAGTGNPLFVVDHCNDLTAGEWTPVPPAEQWPIAATEWLHENASETALFYKVRVEDSTP